LGNPTGGTQLGSPDTTTVTITDNERALIKGSVTLQGRDSKPDSSWEKLVSVSLTPDENLVNVGVLLEGDTNDDNCVTILVFSILASTFGLETGDPDFDPRADFNQDGFVTILDFSLLGANFGQCGALNPSMMVSPLMATSNGTVVMSVVPSTTQVKVGETSHQDVHMLHLVEPPCLIMLKMAT
jgi:hypothetical protein